MAGARRPAGIAIDDRGTRRALDHMADALDDLPERAGLPAAEAVARDAYGRAPVRSGALRSSIDVALEGEVATVTAGDADTPYARVIHDGWPARNITGQPFLRDALDAQGEEIVKVYDREVDELIRRFDRETPP